MKRTTHENSEQRLHALLTEAAEQIPQDLDLRATLLPQIHAQVEARQVEARTRAATSSVAGASRPASGRRVFGTRRAPQLGTRKPSRSALAGALLAAVLVFSAFAFARPLVLSWLGDSSLKAIALQDGTVIDRSVTVQGVTVHLEEGYADAARTVLTMHISGGDPRHPPSPYMPSMRIIDAAGGTYQAITGSGFNDDSLFEFLPLSTDALGAPQSLTFVIDRMQRMTDDLQEVATFAGPWQITFQLRTQAGRAIALSVPGQEHGGITLQPERIELAPAGVRLMVRVSGVPADTSFFSLMHFALHGTEIVACPPGQHVCGSTSGSTRDGGRMLLAGPDGQTMPPAWVAVVSPAPSDGVPIGAQAVGPSGAAELEFLFFEPLRATSGTARATFDEVRIASAINADGTEQRVPGPWVFDLPLG